MLLSTPNKPTVDKETIRRILGSVSYDRGFHFFTDVGKYTGETAINLFSFAEELRTVDSKALQFHFQRGDFQRWVRDTLGDSELAKQLDSIDPKTTNDELRKELRRLVQTRFEELQALSKML
jgi:hypothetical protein